MFQRILPVLCLLLVLTVLPAAAAVPPPLPNDINIVAPGPEVPEKLAALSGKWAGQFSWTGLNGGASGSRELVLVVEKIEGDQVSVIFSYGSDPRSKEKWTRAIGTFSSLNKLKIPLKPPFSRADVTEEFTLKPDGTLAFWAPPSSPYGSDFNGILKKQP